MVCGGWLDPRREGWCQTTCCVLFGASELSYLAFGGCNLAVYPGAYFIFRHRIQAG
ncbi:hypothetical protein MCP1_120039 [Candidatus Terasakiella magnetica]|nr:hypothetical protein MCP1_120039 [Candidatus Terasakiella magnetica]